MEKQKSKLSNKTRNSQESPSAIAVRRFRKNPVAMAGFVFIALLTIVWIAGPFIRPDDTVHANDQHLEISRMKPGFSVQMLILSESKQNESFFTVWTNGGRSKTKRELPIQSATYGEKEIVVIPIQGNALADTIRISSEECGIYSEADLQKRIHRKTYYLGTDKYGRDLLSRLMAGTSISLSVGAIAVLISLLVGLTLGLTAGYFRGWTDNIIMWFTNVIWAVPTLLLVMAITFAFGTGFWKVFLAVGLTMWVEVARIARGQVLSIREKEFVEAARALGYSEFRIIFRHILPNILSPIIVISAANFASAILIEAGLSFLGLGAQIPTPSWGNMIREHYAFITTDLAYLAIIPGLVIMLLVLAFMLVGNGLRDALDVRE